MTTSTLSTRFVKHRSTLLMWTVILATFVLTYVSYVRWFRVFYPDSRFYLAMTYLFLGNSPEQARDLTVAYAAPRDIAVPEVDLLFGWGLVQPRVAYPALSTPFVGLFGPPGLAVIPLLATLALMVILVLVLRRRYGTLTAVAVMVLVNTSMFLVSFQTGMLTESLSALWSAVALVLAWRWMRVGGPWLLVAMGVVTVASAFTRQATLIMAGAFVMAWVLGSIIQRRNSRWMSPAIIVGGTTIVCQVLQTVIFPSFSQLDQFVTQAGADSLGGALANVPRMALDIIRADVITMLRSDRAILVMICLAVAGMVLFWRRSEAHLLFGAILATGIYNITNGTPTQFRYATPGLVFWVLCAALVVAATARWLRNRSWDSLLPEPSVGAPSEQTAQVRVASSDQHNGEAHHRRRDPQRDAHDGTGEDGHLSQQDWHDEVDQEDTERRV